MAEVPEVRRRIWADVAAILAALMLCGFAIWPVPFADTSETVRRVSIWWVYALAGGLSVVGVILGQRGQLRNLAQGLIFAAVGVLAYGLITRFRDLGPAAVFTVVIPGVLLLLAAPFFGPMPRAAEHPR